MLERAQGPPFANYDHLRFYHKLNYESSNRSPLFLDGFKVCVRLA